MKARLNGTNDAFVEIAQISFANNPSVIYDASIVEFEQQQEPTTDHWQDVRERAAIAAMQGATTIVSTPNQFSQFAVACADALIKELKKK